MIDDQDRSEKGSSMDGIKQQIHAKKQEAVNTRHFHEQRKLNRKLREELNELKDKNDATLSMIRKDYDRNVLDEQNKRKNAIAAWKKAIEYSPEEPVYIFHLAEDCDKYYRDKKIARRYYQKYFDSRHPQYREYVAKKIKYLNEMIHLSGD